MSISGGLFGTRGEEGMYIDDWLADGVTLSPNTDPVTLAEGYNWKVAIPVPGSPENPWDIAAPTSEQPVTAYTNGNGTVVIEGVTDDTVDPPTHYNFPPCFRRSVVLGDLGRLVVSKRSEA